MKIVELYSDGLKDEPPQAQGLNGYNNNNNYGNNNNNYGNNNYYNDGRSNNPYDNNPYNNYNRDRFGNSGYRNDRLDSSFTTERSAYNENGLNESVQYEKFRIFESKRYGKVNLLFQVSKKEFEILENKFLFVHFFNFYRMLPNL